MENRALKPISLPTASIFDFNTLNMKGVNHIIGFDSSAVLLDTAYGRIMIEGNDLKIESLEKGSGDITVTGEIYGIRKEQDRKKGFFARIFS